MKQIRITDGVSLSQITLGAMQPIADGDYAIPDRYRALGGMSFDTARMYYGGKYDGYLGKYVRTRGIRHEVAVCMKGCYPAEQSKMHISRLAPADIRFDLEESLRAFGTDYADLYLLHRDDPAAPVSDIVPALDALVREGKARCVGVSNWTVGRIQMANEFAKENGLAPLCVSQLHHSLALTTPPLTGDITHVPMNSTEMSWYRDNDFPVMAFASQGKGFFAQYENGGSYKNVTRDYYSHLPENMARAARACVLAREKNVSASVVALSYILSGKLRASALCGFSSVNQYEDSIRALENPLSGAEIDFLENG